MHAQPQSSPAPAFCKACRAPLHNPLQAIGRKNGFDLLRCVDCGTVTVDPFPTAEQLTAFYQSYQGTVDYPSKKEQKIRRAKKRVQRLMRYTHGKKLLDVGCNYGFTVKAALNLGLDAHGIDIDSTAVTASKKMFGEPLFTSIAVQNYAAAGNKADMIYTSEVIEHVPDPDGFVRALADILNPGGVLYLTTPDGGHWSLPRDFTQWPACTPPEHITYFTRKGLRHLLEKHGLTLEKFLFSWKPGIQLIARRK